MHPLAWQLGVELIAIGELELHVHIAAQMHQSPHLDRSAIFDRVLQQL